MTRSSFHAALLYEWHEDDRPAGFEQHAFVDDFVGQRILPFRLADNNQIETPADAADLVGGARNTGLYRAALRRNAGAFGRLLETGNGGACLRAGFCALTFDDSGGIPPITLPGMTGS